ncbi:hypothetical protein VM1G_11230 [Cytospora mali]|uniref:Uncharacterized protein n=1 Tax=Cytospora mali TaxID=578113 RepID=A0A194VKP7_CYTMA|nr:hypothetical protein VM1G_11230 [Valsa mali]
MSELDQVSSNPDPGYNHDQDYDNGNKTHSESITTGATVSWSGDDGETLHLPSSDESMPAPVDFCFHYNPISRTASLFKLRTTVELRRRGPRRTPIFLYIEPSRVQTLKLVDATPAVPLPRQEDSASATTPGCNSVRLHFVLNRPADLIVPKNVPLRASQAAQAQLVSVRLLARQTVFDVHLDGRRAPAPERHIVESLCQAVSDKSLSSINPAIDISSLYAGHGGRIVDPHEDQHVADLGLAEDPPEYSSLDLPPSAPPAPTAKDTEPGAESSSRKRPRSGSDEYAGQDKPAMLGPEDVKAIFRRLLAEQQAKDKETLRKELRRMEDRLMDQVERRLEERIGEEERRVDDLVNEQVEILDEQISLVDRHVDDRVDFEVDERVVGIQLDLQSFIKDELNGAEERIKESLTRASFQIEFDD